MKFFVVTLFPEMVQQGLGHGVVGQAFKKGELELVCENPRRHTSDLHQSVDDRPYGGGDGMVMLAEPLAASVDAIRAQGARGPIIYLSPKGQVFSDAWARKLSQEADVTLICGRYGGVDERFLVEKVDFELSLGDFVLSGGEVAALAMIDAIARHIPGVLGNQESAREESFGNGLLESPQFTRPREYHGLPIPDVLLSGHHQKIAEWRKWASYTTTLLRRPDLLYNRDLKDVAPELMRWMESFSEPEWRACGFTVSDEKLLKERLSCGKR